MAPVQGLGERARARRAEILGPQARATGRIKLHTPIFRPQRLTLSLDGKDDEDIDAPYVGDAYSYEAAEVMKCLGEGKLQSEIMPLEETLEIMRTMDEIRSQWGLKYPGE